MPTNDLTPEEQAIVDELSDDNKTRHERFGFDPILEQAAGSSRPQPGTAGEGAPSGSSRSGSRSRPIVKWPRPSSSCGCDTGSSLVGKSWRFSCSGTGSTSRNTGWRWWRLLIGAYDYYGDASTLAVAESHLLDFARRGDEPDSVPVRRGQGRDRRGRQGGSPRSGTSDSQRNLPDIEDACAFCQRDLPLPPELVEGLLHQGSKMSLGGASKAYKSWSLLDLALSVGYGMPWLGCHTVQSRVLVINLEILSRRSAASGSTPWRTPVASSRNRHGWTHGTCAVTRPPTGKSSPRSSSVSETAIMGLSSSTRSTSCTGMLTRIRHGTLQPSSTPWWRSRNRPGQPWRSVVHFSKGNQSGKNAIDRVSGSGVFARDPDTILTLTAHEEPSCFTLDATLRNLPPMESFVLACWQYPMFVRDGSLNPARLKTVGRPATYTPDDLLKALGESRHGGNGLDARCRMLKGGLLPAASRAGEGGQGQAGRAEKVVQGMTALLSVLSSISGIPVIHFRGRRNYRNSISGTPVSLRACLRRAA